jgi:hypothetical protein
VRVVVPYPAGGRTDVMARLRFDVTLWELHRRVVQDEDDGRCVLVTDFADEPRRKNLPQIGGRRSALDRWL